MVAIPLGGRFGGVALVDDADARLAAFRWTAWKAPDGVMRYAVRCVRRGGKNVRVYLHREVLGPDAPRLVDHVNRDGLDCRRSNLRPATRRENGSNRGPQKNSASGFKGVSRNPRLRSRPWGAWIQDGKSICLGRYATAEEAAKAYDAAARERFGAFAFLNFPLNHQQSTQAA